jgi:inactivated superfamily I helicase
VPVDRLTGDARLASVKVPDSFRRVNVDADRVTGWNLVRLGGVGACAVICSRVALTEVSQPDPERIARLSRCRPVTDRDTAASRARPPGH